jgi:hypothetical protein
MKNKLRIAGFVTVLVVLTVFMMGCTTMPIEKAYPDRFEKTKIGMDIEEFKQVWPEAKRVGETQDEVIYEFIYGNTVIYTPAYLVHEKFYFTDNKLTKYEGERP